MNGMRRSIPMTRARDMDEQGVTGFTVVQGRWQQNITRVLVLAAIFTWAQMEAVIKD